MTHRRVDAAGRFVVFQNLIGPPNKTYGLKPAEAFVLILERCEYKAVWSTEGDRLLLHFQRPDGVLAAVRFERRIEFNVELDKDLLLPEVFENGLKGWKALPSDRYAIVHAIAEQDLHNPSRSWRLGATSLPR